MAFDGKLENAPLIHVIGAVGFTPILNIAAFIPALHDELRNKYPFVNQMKFSNIEVMASEAGPMARGVEVQAWHFATPDRVWGVMVGPTQLSLHTRGYERSQDFFARFQEVIAAAIAKLRLTHLTGFGLRYVDFIKPNPGEPVTKYVPPEMLGRQMHGIAGKQRDGFVGASFDTAVGGVLAIRSWLNPTPLVPADIEHLFKALHQRPPVKGSEDVALLDTEHTIAVGSPTPVGDARSVVLELAKLKAACRAVFDEFAQEHAIEVWSKKEGQ